MGEQSNRGFNEHHMSKRSTSDAPSRMMGESSHARETYEPARQSMYVEGSSRQYWNQYGFQVGITTPTHHIDTQASQQDSLNTSGIQIPA
ncbi:hypothetical protein MA16_Dca000553 [Dendrobium catenatum]|uniref:Uncharacterized protein n=1 Tax=Dendrobium catenatum TaxID=906689 RepID=A0A2I0WU71_9ASPA|nr:hypothetical protein MA16_Dca000553 [Dendrobium catenatum]